MRNNLTASLCGMLVIVTTFLAPLSAQQKYPVAQSTKNLVIDGNLGDPAWEGVPQLQMRATEPGVPQELGGHIRVVLRGSDLILAAMCPEPGGKVLARSVGRNPSWEKDSAGSLEVEDRLQYSVVYKSVGGIERNLTLAVNPWGAYRIEQDGVAVPAEIRAAALVTSNGWTIEATVPLDLLDLDRSAENPAMRLKAERIRSRRALAPEFRWVWPATGEAWLTLPAFTGMVTGLSPPEFRPHALGNNEPPLQVGRMLRVPALDPEWGVAAWRGVRAFTLPRNEPAPRIPAYPTEVKWVHDGRTLALLVRATEPDPVVARAGGRDSAVASDDHIALYLATSGSSFLEIAVNPVGAISDSQGTGYMIPQPGWNAPIETRTNIRYGGWTARINVPLQACAEALGEDKIPADWRIVIARYRADRPGEPAEVSAVPMIPARTFYGPIRYRRMNLSDMDPGKVSLPDMAYPERPASGLAGELASIDPHVWTPLDRRYRAVRTMVHLQQQKRAKQAILAEHRAWDRVETREEWERFRDQRLQALRDGIGAFPKERPPLDVRVSSRYEGDGWIRENLVYQSLPGSYVAANLYIPARPFARMPGIIIVPSNHFPKIQGELQDMGMIWARAGCAVLVIERIGFGERAETTPWYRQALASQQMFSKQLFLIGQSYSGWSAWDLIRAVDFFHARPDIDRDSVILIGSVAGGGEPAAVAAALDPRVSAVIPFNYDQGHVRVHGDERGQIAGQYPNWVVAASVAPRRFIRAFEFGWEGAEEPDYPELWVSGWLRSQKVWDFYGARDNLAASQGFGLIRLSTERVSHCWSVGPNQRKDIYPILNRWFHIPMPSQQEYDMPNDSALSTTPDKSASRLDEARRRRPETDLRSITPALSAELHRRPVHEIARETAVAQLQAVRREMATLTPPEARQKLRRDLSPLLGDIEPSRLAEAEPLWTRSLSGATVEAAELRLDGDIDIPLLLIRGAGKSQAPVVVAVSQAGKGRFLADRSRQIAALIQAGVSVCIPDLRGTGETSPDFDNGDDDGAGREMANMEFQLSNTLLGARLRDLRTVIAYLRQRPDTDRQRIGLWGDSFAPTNAPDLVVDELQWNAGPQFQYRAEPAGAHLALLAALFEDDVKAIAARGGLGAYLSLLDDAFTYVPMDVVVPGVLKAGDIADIAGAVAPRALLLEGLVNGRNTALTAGELDRETAPAKHAYERSQAAGRLTVRAGSGDLAGWLVSQLH
jgi:dienelactone hydrolase